MDTFATISGWIQIVLLLATLLLAQRVAAQFREFPAWRAIWIAFAVGFAGMFESRILVVLFAYQIEWPWMKFCNRFVTPLQASIGLFVGMMLLARMLRRLQSMHQVRGTPRQDDSL